jgi:hypothetical protein
LARTVPRYFYKGIPLIYHSGDLGVISRPPFQRRPDELNIEKFILARDMREEVEINPRFASQFPNL